MIAEIGFTEISFPEITRDDVFRLETRRLWLRWPEVGDAEAVAAIAGTAEVAELTVNVPHPYPKGEASRQIEGWRAVNASGGGLTLILTGRGGDRRPIGLVGLERVEGGAKIGLLVAPTHWGQGLATEAVQAMVDAAFTISALPRIEASARVINPAARRMLERCGFAYDATVLKAAPARGGMMPCDCFRLDRKLWASLKQWRMPAIDGRLPQARPTPGVRLPMAHGGATVAAGARPADPAAPPGCLCPDA